MANESFDYVIVGAGSAGCVLADRLSADGRCSVLLLEYGGSDRSIFIQMPSALSIPMNMEKYNWFYHTEPEPHLDGRRMHTPRGKVLGGSSSINGLVYIRGNAQDFEGWSALGAAGWAYRDVLFMLIHYSIASFEVLERKLSANEKEEVFDVFYRLGKRMNLQGLPENYNDWLKVRAFDLEQDLKNGDYSIDLYKQYRKHLGAFRFRVLLEGQIMIVPDKVRDLLHFRKFSFLSPFVPLYKISRLLKLDGLIKSIILPKAYKKEFKQLDISLS